VSLTGVWLGTLATGGKGLRLQLHLNLAPTPATCALDSLDQGAPGIPCTNVVASTTELSIEVPAVHGSLKGTVSADANTVTATWKQGSSLLPIVLTRQPVALEEVKQTLDPAVPPVTIDKLQAVLDADLAKARAGRLTPSTGVGVTIGVVDHGTRKVFSYGAAKPDSVFEIGSITKTFTGLTLAQLAQQKKVNLAEPIRALLPNNTVAAPGAGAEITLLDLSAQRSGLPRLPDNLRPADVANPYVDYDAKALYAFMASHGVALPAHPEFGYSNLGVGLLGQLLADRAGVTFEALVKEQITAPLGMRDTTVELTPALARRFAPGHHGEDNEPQGAWDFAALAGAGAIRSTATDMLKYLEAQLHPDRVKGKSVEAQTLPAALAASHEVRGDVGGGVHIALNWFRFDGSGRYWHNGATGGYSSYATFDLEADYAVVVLCNCSSDDGSFADDLGDHIVQRLTGKPAITLAR
jgi:CubicO group peptidase (beta-lactamase class C family)